MLYIYIYVDETIIIYVIYIYIYVDETIIIYVIYIYIYVDETIIPIMPCSMNAMCT